jgi:hypothetical protein
MSSKKGFDELDRAIANEMAKGNKKPSINKRLSQARKQSTPAQVSKAANNSRQEMIDKDNAYKDYRRGAGKKFMSRQLWNLRNP